MQLFPRLDYLMAETLLMMEEGDFARHARSDEKNMCDADKEDDGAGQERRGSENEFCNSRSHGGGGYAADTGNLEPSFDREAFRLPSRKSQCSACECRSAILGQTCKCGLSYLPRPTRLHRARYHSPAPCLLTRHEDEGVTAGPLPRSLAAVTGSCRDDRGGSNNGRLCAVSGCPEVEVMSGVQQATGAGALDKSGL